MGIKRQMRGGLTGGLVPKRALAVIACVGTGALSGCAATSSEERESTGEVHDALGPAQKVAIPSYYWFNAADWASVTPQNGVGLAMLNPQNGRLEQLSGASISGFQSRLAQLQGQSPRPLVFGYVYTRYANTDPNNRDGGLHDRSVAQVASNIDSYFQHFPTSRAAFRSAGSARTI